MPKDAYDEEVQQLREQNLARFEAAGLDEEAKAVKAALTKAGPKKAPEPKSTAKKGK